MSKKILKFVYLFLLVFVYACEKSDIATTIQPENKSTVNSTINNVSQETAIIVANNFLKEMNNLSEVTRRGTTTDKTVLETITFKTMNDENAIYAINYAEGGYVVVAADNRVSPIQAFSEDGNFDRNINEIPDPVVTWIEEERKAVQYLKTTNIDQIGPIAYQWNYLLTLIGNPGICAPFLIQKGPLLQTTWGQSSSYNDLIGVSCPNQFNVNEQAPTGCVATAMAQVMKFHNFPDNYNWNAMPNDFGTIHTQLLMRNIGISIGMNYTCQGSGADTSQAHNIFMNNFGYSNANYTDVYNTDYIIQNLTANAPVIVKGGRMRGGIYFPWNDYANGHAWVCDGYRLLVLRAPQPNGSCFEWGFKFLHMNWGWEPSLLNTAQGIQLISYNGWFNENNFNPSIHTFNYERGMVFNIVP